MCTVISSAVQRRVWRPQFAHTPHTSAHTTPQSAHHTNNTRIWICALFGKQLFFKNKAIFQKVNFKKIFLKVPKKYSKKYQNYPKKRPKIVWKALIKNILKSTEKYIIKSLHTTVPVTTTTSTRPEARALSLTEQRHGWQQLDWRGASEYWNSFISPRFQR